MKNKITFIILIIISFLQLTNLFSIEENEIQTRKREKPYPYSFDKEYEEEIYKVKIKQPDGVIIEVDRIYGGKNNPTSIYQKNGFSIRWDRETNYFCWAERSDNGSLESTGYPIHLYDPEDLKLEKNIRISDERFEEKKYKNSTGTAKN